MYEIKTITESTKNKKQKPDIITEQSSQAKTRMENVAFFGIN